ncbi:peptidylprolyl isomerase [Tenacibaculum sp. UWU-22]|uniref:peptidylprolyl isomerase n=1 Tax=Tenacibaculum sp. UWU-22 TaxID=3234187 RepID=UPI0034DB4F93
MAILSDIRQKPIILIAIVGLALFAFVLNPSSLEKFFKANKVNEVGNVDGETISRQEFAQALDAYKAQVGNRVSEMQAAKTVWDNLVRKKIYEIQLAKAGVTIGEQDIMNALYETPSVKDNPRFLTAGLFDKDKFKEFLATMKDDPAQQASWAGWQNFMLSIKENLERTTYNNLVLNGLGASLKEGETKYLTENTRITGQYVYIPYTSIADSLITIKKSDVQKYIDNHKADYQVKESRDIKYVNFIIKATPKDEEAIKKEVAKLIDDRQEYSSVTKGDVTIKGLKNTEDYVGFLEENKSDISLDDTFKFKNEINAQIADKVMSGNKGDVFGPYKEGDYFKISKITEITKMPDSVKASHILIPFLGSRSATAETKQNEAAAKKTTDSILAVVKQSPSKFNDLAKQFSVDKSNADKGGELGWFTYSRMVPEFRDYCFTHKTGDLGVVKTQFGFHIVKIQNQKNIEKAVKLATYARKIEASEETENAIFQEAETFALEVSNGKKFDDVVSEKKLNSNPVIGIKALDENITGLGNQRQIINWAFDADSEVGSFKRFDTDKGYVVATVTAKTEEGLMPVEKAITSVRPILTKQKKTELINSKINGATLGDIAQNNKQMVKQMSDVTLASPTISGVGNEPNVVAAMQYAKENELYKGIEGNKGVFAFVVTKRTLPPSLPNYDSYRNRIASERKGESFAMYNALKSALNVEDNISNFYGIQ